MEQEEEEQARVTGVRDNTTKRVETTTPEP